MVHHRHVIIFSVSPGSAPRCQADQETWLLGLTACLHLKDHTTAIFLLQRMAEAGIPPNQGWAGGLKCLKQVPCDRLQGVGDMGCAYVSAYFAYLAHIRPFSAQNTHFT